MSFDRYHDTITDGSLVVLYLGSDRMYPITVRSGDVFQTRFGVLKHSQLVDQPFGAKIQLPKGYCHVLHPTPEIWTQVLPHRTQILYHTDIATILFQLDIKPGCVVVEAGTGSGSLSHSIARALLPNGRLHTFEFHEERVKTASAEFAAHGLNSVVACQHLDVCADEGFPKPIRGTADAVFLDLPSPWKCVGHAVEVMRPGRVCRFAAFSPCIEQVQQTVLGVPFTQHQALQNKTECFDITTLECLSRRIQVRSCLLPHYKATNRSMKRQRRVLKSAQKDRKRRAADVNGDESSEERTSGEASEDAEGFSVMASAVRDSCGHTGFLTFCSVLPK